MKELSPIKTGAGLTEEAYRGLPIGRRSLLILGLTLPLLASCARPDPQVIRLTVEPLQLEPTGGIRREIGIWTPLEVANLGMEMLEERNRGLNDIAFAGGVLLDNQRGVPGALAKMSSIFEEGRIKVETVSSISGDDTQMNLPAPASASIKTSGSMNLDLKSRIGEPTLKMKAPTAIHYEKIEFGHNDTKDISDMMLKFYMAKELFNAKAFGMISNYAVVEGIAPFYVMPGNESSRRALQLSLFDGVMGGQSRVPVAFIGDMWAHFLLVPDYLKASENGFFTQEEISSPGLSVFKLASEVFQREKVLTKNGAGDYEWSKDSAKFYYTWFSLAEAGYKVFGKQSPKSPN